MRCWASGWCGGSARLAASRIPPRAWTSAWAQLGRGCIPFTGRTAARACGGSGFRGRIAILELLVVNEAITRLVMARAEAAEVEAAAIRDGMRSMLADGVAKAAAGLTTLEEVLRVTREA